MRKLKVMLAAVPVFMAALCACSSFSNRGEVDRPFIGSANQYDLSVEKVTLTDTSTVLHAVVHFNPGMWIKIAESSFIEAGGVRYPLSGIDGIALGQEVWMPDSGVIHFTMDFPGIPADAKSIDFSEGIDDGWQLWDIDLTGNATDDINLGKVPSRLLKCDSGAELPEPEIAFGDSTTINIHILGYRTEMGDRLRCYTNTLHGQSELDAPVALDGEGNAVVKLALSAPARFGLIGFSSGNMLPGMAYVAPGESVDLYVDSHASGLWNMSKRDSGRLEFPEGFSASYASGMYSALVKSLGASFCGMQLSSGRFGDYRMSGDEYTDYVIGQYHALMDSVANDSSIGAAGRRMKEAQLNADLIHAAIDAPWILRSNYYFTHRNWGTPVHPDTVPVKLSPENVSAIASLVDFNDKNLLLAEGIQELGNTRLWEENGIDPGLLKAVKLYNEAYQAAGALEPDTAAVVSLRKLFPAMADEVEAHYKACKARFDAIGKDKLVPTPDVADEKLFEAIVAPHKGKVVMVDLWNTWCGPCRAALAANEPLKDGELASDDIVWIYIADETSPLLKYMLMINDIRGVHYRVSPEQIAALRKQFDVDGIPFYILVDRDGKGEGRPDLRDHSRFVEAVKSKL